jgi:acetyl esterase
MPLDPQAKALLDQRAAVGDPPLHQMDPVAARAAVEAGIDRVTPRENVAKIEDREIPGPHGPIPIRIYTPEGSGPFPILVYFHGGGWVVCSIETHDAWSRHITNTIGCIVVAVNYRQAPEDPFPAAVDDAFAAVQWAAANGASFNGDGSRLAVAGDSAGGNLSAAVALIARDQGGPKLAYQVLITPGTDYYNLDQPAYKENAVGYGMDTADIIWLMDLYYPAGTDRNDPRAFPVRAKDHSGVAPAMVITAEYDSLRDDGDIYAAKLRDAGVPVVWAPYEGMTHNFLLNYAVMDRAEEAVKAMAAALREAFGLPAR